MEIRDHVISDAGLRVVDRPNKGGSISPEYLIMHYTAGRDVDSSMQHFCTPSAKASAHLVIGRDGRVCQLVQFNRRAWHAGQSAWAGRDGLNGFSIGIELDNAGKLVKVGNQYQAWFGGRYPEDAVIQARHKSEQDPAYWHAFPEPQMWMPANKTPFLTRGIGMLMDGLGSSEPTGIGMMISTAGDDPALGRFMPNPGTRVLTEDGRDVVPGSGETGSSPSPARCRRATARTPTERRDLQGDRRRPPLPDPRGRPHSLQR